MHPADESSKPHAGADNFGKHGEDENNSIGSGSSDQGIDAENESREDEIIAMEEHNLQLRQDEKSTSHRPPPTHGLVEERPGPHS